MSFIASTRRHTTDSVRREDADERRNTKSGEDEGETGGEGKIRCLAGVDREIMEALKGGE